MMNRITLLVTAIGCNFLLHAQQGNRSDGFPNAIKPVGIIKYLSDSALLDLVQRQTFRYFWHFGYPVSGLARERSNTVRADYFWDYANEAYDEPNFSKGTLNSASYFNGKTYYGYKLPLGFEYGGPLFFSQYTFMGIDPHSLESYQVN